MDVDEALRRAGSDLRAATASPRLRPPGAARRSAARRSAGWVARPWLVVAGVTAVTLVAVWATVAGAPGPQPAPPATPAPTASVENLCGRDAVPASTYGPEGWTPSTGPAPGAAPASAPGQFVVHLSGPDGSSVEMRWPADPGSETRPWTDTAATADVLVGPPSRLRLDLPDDARAVALVTDKTYPGACRYLAVTWRGPVPDGYGDGWGEYASSDDTPELRRAVQAVAQFVRGDPHLVSGVDRVTSAPKVQTCSGDASVTSGRVADNPAFSAPEAALQRAGALGTAPLPATPWRKLVDGQGRVWFSTLSRGVGSALVTTRRTAAGWVVQKWEADFSC